MKRPAADEILYAPTEELVTASMGSVRFKKNERRQRPRVKQKFDVAALDLYAGYASFLVRTAVIRASDYDPTDAPVIAAPGDVFRVVAHLQYADQEHFVTLAVDSARRLRAIHETAVGGTSAALVEAGHVVKLPLLVGASAVLVAHNHPSQSKRFSDDDVRMTHALSSATRCVGLTLLDHVLVTRTGWLSFLEEYGNIAGR